MFIVLPKKKEKKKERRTKSAIRFDVAVYGIIYGNISRVTVEIHIDDNGYCYRSLPISQFQIFQSLKSSNLQRSVQIIILSQTCMRN